MDSNALGYLSLQNPFFLNHTRLEMLGVNVLVTPTLFTFAQVCRPTHLFYQTFQIKIGTTLTSTHQLQNYYIWTATENLWPLYFWSHMDLVSLSLESPVRFAETITPTISLPVDPEPWENQTLYKNCLFSLRNVTSPDPKTGELLKWASVFFSYDRSRWSMLRLTSRLEPGTP